MRTASKILALWLFMAPAHAEGPPDTCLNIGIIAGMAYDALLVAKHEKGTIGMLELANNVSKEDPHLGKALKGMIPAMDVGMTKKQVVEAAIQGCLESVKEM